ncbi:cytochrome P450 [Heliocybe sulcata]|uniref:Cytochrome P450 n=1 Tax=Heliocybe sulcata TaxID=5364 RepID=A0A5C3MVR5_9AGAM|nr:cytochrome P450 [Heliocybe sulcata]
MWSSAVLAGLVVLATVGILRYHSLLKKVSYLPGLRCAFAPLSLAGAALPTSAWNPGLDWPWEWKWDVYKRYKSQTISCIPLIRGQPYIYTSSMEVAKQILNGRPDVFKAPDSNGALSELWGDNVVSSDYDMYKRHRRVVGPAFSRAGYVLVAEEVSKLYREMVESEGWLNTPEICIQSVNDYLSKFALGIISRCGFGLPFPWADTANDDRDMPFRRALALVSENSIIRLATPAWMYKLPIPKLHTVDKAFRSASTFMRSLISAKKAELGSQTEDVTRSGQDLLTRLVAASEAEGKNGLSDQELFGNVFIFMFAGHETTAHTLAATLALLSVHQDEQNKAVEIISKVLGDERQPTLEDVESGSLDKVLACFEEAARLFPPGSIATRDTTETITLAVPDEDGGGHLVIPPGVRLVVDFIGLHYNPSLFPNPGHYDPSRWYGARETDMSFFSIGPRACIGRKFAIVEALCFLSLFLRDWKVEPLLNKGETADQWKERCLQAGFAGLTFGVRDIPLKITRRTDA